MRNIQTHYTPTYPVFLCLISVIIGPQIGFADLSFIPLFCITVFFVCRDFFNGVFNKLNLPYEACIFIAFWILLFILALLSFLYHGSVSTQALLKPIRQILLISFLCILFSRFIFKPEQILSIIVYASTINALVVLIQYTTGLLIPGSAGDFLMNPGFDESINMVWRKPGLFAGYPHAAVLSAFGCVVSMFLIIQTAKYRYYLTFIMSFITLFITSRTGLMLGILGISLLLPYLIFSSKKNFIILVVLGVCISVFFVFIIKSGVLAKDTIPMMFEIFINLAEGKGASSASQTALYESFSYDVNYVSTLFIGNGLEHHADNGLNVDAGFQQSFFTSGFFGLIITHLIFLLMMGRVIYNPLSGWKFNINSFVFLFLFLSVFIANLKAGFMFSRGPGDVILLLYCFKVVADKRAKCG
ncbi:hypothetical protein QK281_07305 [Aeromonas hydrophila]|uniref:hypothetical protein n=1 Tax=Aeromonas hydrophila TaxID=644 RepID=UPI00249F8F63|nr:hypothetical protein [Aeromonas hydrophila]WGY33619.1 hypothetical protein QK281_07305 [Aeromonas hydrophila]HDC4325029.1 hypothetical protein [Aeromonas hydrophila]